MKIFQIRMLIVLSVMTVFFMCNKHSLPVAAGSGGVQGQVVWNYESGKMPAAGAWIIWEDSLLAKTSQSGEFDIPSIDEGMQSLLCSALFARDTTVQINVIADDNNTLNFELTPDSTMGRVNGEFQDMPLFQQKLAENPAMKQWSEKEKFEGVTGATLKAPLGDLYNACTVSLGGALQAYDDNWGQYWFKIQAGTYPLTGASEGRPSQTRIIKVLPDEWVYLNFYLDRN